jgi:hypothetical protein
MEATIKSKWFASDPVISVEGGQVVGTRKSQGMSFSVPELGIVRGERGWNKISATVEPCGFPADRIAIPLSLVVFEDDNSDTHQGGCRERITGLHFTS